MGDYAVAIAFLAAGFWGMDMIRRVDIGVASRLVFVVCIAAMILYWGAQ